MEISATERNKAEKGTRDKDRGSVVLNSTSWELGTEKTIEQTWGWIEAN